MPAYDPEGKLSADKETWLALGVNHGGPFRSRAASELTSGLPYNPAVGWECRYWLVYSALARGDARAVRVFVNDWSHQRGRPAANVTKWVPGDHYHTLGERFDTLEEAKEHLRKKGYEFGGFSETHAYKRDGD